MSALEFMAGGLVASGSGLTWLQLARAGRVERTARAGLRRHSIAELLVRLPEGLTATEIAEQLARANDEDLREDIDALLADGHIHLMLEPSEIPRWPRARYVAAAHSNGAVRPGPDAEGNRRP